MAMDLGIPASEYNNPEINIVGLEIRDHIIAHYYLHKIFGGKMTYAFHHFTKSVPGWQNLDINKAINEIAMSVEKYQKIAPKMRRGRKLNIASFADAVPSLDSEDIFRDGQNKALKILGDHPTIKRIPKDASDKRYLGRRTYINKTTGDCKKEFLSENDKNSEWYKVPTYKDKGYRHRIHETLTCPWCGRTGKVPGILSYHFDFCIKNPNAVIRRESFDIQNQEGLGNLTTANAAKETNMSLPHFVRLGKRLFSNKNIPRGCIVFWTRYEIEMICWYKHLTPKERRDPSVFERNDVPQNGC
jgi:hypothetical protein